MFSYIKENLIWIFLGLFIFFTSLGIETVDYYLKYFFLFLPFIFYLIAKPKEIIISKKQFILLAFFFIGLFVNLFFSIDIQITFEKIFIYLSLFLIYIYFLNNEKKGIEKIKWMYLFVGLFLCILSFFYKYILKPDNITAYNLVVELSKNHNFLGDFLVLSVVSLFFLKEKIERKYFYVLLGIFTFFIFTSFSRTAYLALVICMFFIFKYQQNVTKFFKKIPLILMFLFILFVFVVKNTLFFKEFNQKIGIDHNLIGKSLSVFSKRDEFFLNSLTFIQKKPLFGIGLGNFSLNTKNSYLEKSGVSYSYRSSHNLYLDLLVEVGIITGFLFFIFIFLVLYKSKINSEEFVFIIAFLILFFFDYIFLMNQFYLLFFIHLAFIKNKKQEDEYSISFLYLFLSGLLIFISLIMFTSNYYFEKSQYEKAINYYPLSMNSYLFLLEDKIQQNKYEGIINYIEKGNFYFVNNNKYSNVLGDIFRKANNNKMAIYFYKKALMSSNYLDKYYLFEKTYMIQDQSLIENDIKNIFKEQIIFEMQRKHKKSIKEMPRYKKMCDYFFVNNCPFQ